MEKDPLKQFLKIYKSIQEDLKKYSNSDAGYWPFNVNHEVAQEKDVLYGDYFHKTILDHGHSQSICIFLWRDEPNYSCRGRPSYDEAYKQEILEKSETRKDLVSVPRADGLLIFALTRDGFNPDFPSENVWGLKLNPHKFTVFYEKDGQSRRLITTSNTAKLKRWWESNKYYSIRQILDDHREPEVDPVKESKPVFTPVGEKYYMQVAPGVWVYGEITNSERHPGVDFFYITGHTVSGVYCQFGSYLGRMRKKPPKSINTIIVID